MLVYWKCECFVMQMFVSCVHHVAVLNDAFCMTCFSACIFWKLFFLISCILPLNYLGTVYIT